MRTIKLLLTVAFGFIFTFAALEVTFRFLPVNAGLFRTYDQQSWPIRAYTPHAPFIYSRTWEMLLVNRGRTNNYGHIAPFDYVPGSRPVIVIGNSYVAAEMLPYTDMVQAQLAERLHGRAPVYEIGRAS